MFKFRKNKNSGLLADEEEASINPSNQANPSSRQKKSAEYVRMSADIQALDEEDKYHKRDKKCCCCISWKCLCLTCTLTLIVIILTLFLVIYFSVAPNFAQKTLDHAQMDIINGTISNPTKSSITLTTTIMISNAGMLDGSIKAFPVIVSNDDIIVGTMMMPELNTIANQNAIITATSVLNISNVTQFQVFHPFLIYSTHKILKKYI